MTVPAGKADTWTRRELLAARGYPPSVVTGNGHQPAEAPPAPNQTVTKNEGTGPFPPDILSGESVTALGNGAGSGSLDRSCSECGKPVPLPDRPGQPARLTCGPICAAARRARVKREARAARAAAKAQAAATRASTAAPIAEPWKAAQEDVADRGRAKDPEGWFILSALLDARATLSFTVGTVVVKASREV